MGNTGAQVTKTAGYSRQNANKAIRLFYNRCLECRARRGLIGRDGEGLLQVRRVVWVMGGSAKAESEEAGCQEGLGSWGL